MHQPKDRRFSKFSPRAIKGIFVGYGLGSAGYRIWLTDSNKIIESKHVSFDESVLGRDKPSPNSPLLRFLEQMTDQQMEPPYALDDDFTTPAIHQPGPSHIPTFMESRKLTPPEEPHKDESVGKVTGLKEEMESDDSDGSQFPLPESDDEADTRSDAETEEGETGRFKFMRYITVRKKGNTKGRIDIYIKTPCGKTLRSDIALIKYCEEKGINLDNTLANFRRNNSYQGQIILSKKDEAEEETLCSEVEIPQNPKQALSLPQAKCWKKAMDAEINTMLDRKVWEPVDHNPSMRVILTRWVYTVKHNAEGKINTYKARLVAMGNLQREGLDYNQTFSPVINFVLIRFFIALFSCILKWKDCLLDVKCAYLYGDIDKDIYIRQPEGYVIEGKENQVLKLKKALYGLHQSGRCWHHDLHDKLLTHGFIEITGVPCIFIYKGKAVVLVYVDDLPIFAKDRETLDEVVNLIKSIYDVKELGDIKQLLGVEFSHVNNELFNLNCKQYIDKCLTKYQIVNPHVSMPSTPGFQPEPCANDEDIPKDLPFRNLLGCLLYIAQRCRPDVSWPIAALSQFTERHNTTHYRHLIKVLMYLGSTKELGIKFTQSEPPLQITCYVDASWNSTIPERKSWTGYIVFLNDIPISWRVTKQKKVAASPMEAEFVAAAEAVKELKYLTTILNEIIKKLKLNDIPINKPVLYIDNTAAASFITKGAVTTSTRYIDLDLYFVRDYFEAGLFDVKHIATKLNLADMLTKAVPRDLFLKLRSRIMH